MPTWNPWHGCRKISEGCLNCYVHRGDAKYNRDIFEISKNKSFDMPLKKDRSGKYKFESGGTVFTCFTSDFFLAEADEWRKEAWDIMRLRSDLHFLFITKRIHRFYDCIPEDWGDGYDNVTICCTVESQAQADNRLPIFLDAPIKTKNIICEPLLEDIWLEQYLTGEIKMLLAGGESGANARECNYQWVLNLRRQCDNTDVNFVFRQTGANFKKDGKVYKIPRSKQFAQAIKADIDSGERPKMN